MFQPLNALLRARQCPWCRARIQRDDSWNQDDDQFLTFECAQGHTVYVPRPQIQSQIIRLYMWRRRVLAHDVLVEGKWKRIELEGTCDASSYALALCKRGYRTILNRGRCLGDWSNQYRYFRRERDEEMSLGCARVHWEERRTIERDLPVLGM